MRGGVHEEKPIHERCEARGPRIMSRYRPHTRQAAVKEKERKRRTPGRDVPGDVDRLGKFNTHVSSVLPSCPTAPSSGSDEDILGYEREWGSGVLAGSRWMGGARVGMRGSGSQKCTPTTRPKSAAHTKRAHTCSLNPELSPEPEPDKGDVEDTVDIKAEADAACPWGSHVD